MNRLQNLTERVEVYLAEMGLEPSPRSEGLYLLKYGSTVVLVSVFESGEDTFCRVASLLLKDFEPTMELLQRVLRLNAEVLFGSFLLFEDDTLSFSTTILGNHLDFDEFAKSLRYVAKVSDDYDEQLQAIGGGKRASDLIAIGPLEQ